MLPHQTVTLSVLPEPKKTERSGMDVLYVNNRRTINEVKQLDRYQWFRKWVLLDKETGNLENM